MANDTVGRLNVALDMRLNELNAKVEQATATISAMSSKMSRSISGEIGKELDKTAKKIGNTFAISTIAAAAIGEFKHVAASIDEIPGVTDDTSTSINLMNQNLANGRTILDQYIAKGEQAFVNLGTNIGLFAGQLAYGAQNTDAAISSMAKSANDFAHSGFNQKLAELNREYDELTEKSKQIEANGSPSKTFIDNLDKEAAALAKFAETGKLNLEEFSNARLEALQTKITANGGVSRKDTDEAQLQAMQDLIEAQKIENELKEKYRDLQIDISDKQYEQELSIKSTSEQIRILTGDVQLYSKKLSEANDNGDWEKVIDLTKKISDSQFAIKRLEISVGTAAKEIQESFKSAFESAADDLADFVITGENTLGNFANTMARQITSTMAKLAIINPILNSMFVGANGWKALPTLFGGGKAVGGPVDAGTTYLVGENGPELFTPNASGSITPNNRLNSVTGQSSASVVVNVDARGADVGAVQRLESWQREFQRNFKPMVKATMAESRIRGEKI